MHSHWGWYFLVFLYSHLSAGFLQSWVLTFTWESLSLFLLGKNNLPFCPLLGDLNKSRIHSAFSALLFFSCHEIISDCDITVCCSGQPCAVYRRGLNWVNRTHQERWPRSAALPGGASLLQAARRQQPRPAWEGLLFPWTCFRNAGLSLLEYYQQMKLIF